MIADQKPFDPKEHLSVARKDGPKTYLAPKWRVVWLRREHPDASITTEALHLDVEYAVIKATVTLPGGASATGHGQEERGHFADYVEKAETKAVGRALAHLGYGAEHDPDYEEIDDPGRSNGQQRQSGGRQQHAPAELPSAARLPTGDGKKLLESQARAIGQLSAKAGIADRLDDWLGVPVGALAENQAAEVIKQLDAYVRGRKAAAASA